MMGLYCTNAALSLRSGGGNVSYNEYGFLKGYSDDMDLIERRNVHSYLDRMTGDNPFLYDYFTSHLIPHAYDLVHFYAAPFGMTLRTLKQLNGEVKSVTTVAPHNTALSVEEFNRLGMKYPFKHVTDPVLFNIYMRHVIESDLVVFPSKTGRDYMVDRLDLSNETKVIPHGCTIPPQKCSNEKDGFNVSYIGSLGSDKGVIYLVLAWEMLNYKDGSSLDFWGRECRSAASLYGGLMKAGTYNVWGEYKSLKMAADRTSVYVQPSVTEGFGITALEMMSYGVPVIVSEGAGVSEIVRDGVDGFVVPIRNSGAIMEKITFYRDNPSEVKKMGRNARETAKLYSWEKIGKQYIEAYESLFGGDIP